MNRKKAQHVSENEARHDFETEQEKEAYVDKIWKKTDMCIAIEIGCVMASVIAVLIAWNVFKDSLPVWLVEACSFRRGNRNMLPLVGCGAGLPVGELIARILIKLMKLKE